MKKLWIDGEWVPGAQGNGKVRRIENPATLEVVDEVVEGSPDDAKRACLKAAEAGRKWRHLPAIERGKLLHDAATKMREDRARLSELLTLEGGKPRIENLDEVEWSAACLQYYAEIARNSQGCRSRRPASTRSISPSRSRSGWWRPSCRSTILCFFWCGKSRRPWRRATRWSSSRRS